MISELGLDRFENVNLSTHSEILLLILIRGYNTTKRNENKKEMKNKQNKDKNKRRGKMHFTRILFIDGELNIWNLSQINFLSDP